MVSTNLCRVKRSLKPFQNEHNSVKETGQKGKKPCNIDLYGSLGLPLQKTPCLDNFCVNLPFILFFSFLYYFFIYFSFCFIFLPFLFLKYN